MIPATIYGVEKDFSTSNTEPLSYWNTIADRYHIVATNADLAHMGAVSNYFKNKGCIALNYVNGTIGVGSWAWHNRCVSQGWRLLDGYPSGQPIWESWYGRGVNELVNVKNSTCRSERTTWIKDFVAAFCPHGAFMDMTGNAWKWDPYYSTTDDISTIVGVSGTVTVATTAIHNLAVDDSVTIAGTVNFNGTYYVVTVPTTTTFTFAKAGDYAQETVGTVTSYARVYDPATGSVITDVVWRDEFSIALLDALRAQGVTVCANGIGTDRGNQGLGQCIAATGGDTFEELLTHTDYIIQESYLRSADRAIGSFKPEGTDPLADVDTWWADCEWTRRAGNKGITYFSVEMSGATTAQLNQWFDYALSSYLTVASPSGHFAPRHWQYPAYDSWTRVNRALNNIGTANETFTNLAQAKGRLRKGPNVYHRSFSKGLALVNPSNTDNLGVYIGGGYKDMDGNNVVSIDMLAHTGVVLLADLTGVVGKTTLEKRDKGRIALGVSQSY